MPLSLAVPLAPRRAALAAFETLATLPAQMRSAAARAQGAGTLLATRVGETVAWATDGTPLGADVVDADVGDVTRLGCHVASYLALAGLPGFPLAPVPEDCAAADERPDVWAVARLLPPGLSGPDSGDAPLLAVTVSGEVVIVPAARSYLPGVTPKRRGGAYHWRPGVHGLTVAAVRQHLAQALERLVAFETPTPAFPDPDRRTR